MCRYLIAVISLGFLLGMTTGCASITLVITPAASAVATQVQIVGTSFGTEIGKVLLDGAEVEIVEWRADQITVKVPVIPTPQGQPTHVAVKVLTADGIFKGSTGFTVIRGILVAHFVEEGLTFKIFVMNPDGSGKSLLTPEPWREDNPAWSPDGTRFAFAAIHADGEIGLFIKDADGSNETSLFTSMGEFVANEPSWSPDGKHMVFSCRGCLGEPSWQLYIINSDGTGLRPLTSSSMIHAAEPDWSPDGQKIAFWGKMKPGSPGEKDSIFVIHPDGSGLRQLTDNVTQDMSPVWSSDGSRIAYAAEPETLGPFNIFAMNSDGSEKTNLTSNFVHRGAFEPVWSPDSSEIAFILIDQQFSGNVYKIKANGTGLVQLTFEENVGEASLAWR